MGYATVLHVNALNTGRPNFTGSTKPTSTQVIQYLEETAGVIDGILHEKGYTVPVPSTATGAYKTLEHFNAIGGHAFVEQASQQSDRRDEAMKLWEYAQKMLRDGIIELDAPRDEVSSLPRASFPATPMFSRDMET